MNLQFKNIQKEWLIKPEVSTKKEDKDKSIN